MSAPCGLGYCPACEAARPPAPSRTEKQYRTHNRSARCSCAGCTAYREKYTTEDATADRAALTAAGRLYSNLRGVTP